MLENEKNENDLHDVFFCKKRSSFVNVTLVINKKKNLESELTILF